MFPVKIICVLVGLCVAIAVEYSSSPPFYVSFSPFPSRRQKSSLSLSIAPIDFFPVYFLSFGWMGATYSHGRTRTT